MTGQRRKALAAFRRGVELFKAGQLPDARNCLAEAVALDTGLADAHHGLGVIALRQGELAYAVDCLRRATACNPRQAAYFANLGVALRRLKRYDEALAAYDSALALEPRNPTVMNNRGNVQRDRGNTGAALADYDRAIALQPDYAEAHYNRGVLLQKVSRHEDALAALAEAVRLRPDYVEAWNSRGNVLRDVGRWDDSLEEYDCAIAAAAASPGDAGSAGADAHYNRAAVLRDQGDGEAAGQDLRAALALRPGYVEARWALPFSVLTPVYDTTEAMAAARAEFAARFDELEALCRATPGTLADWEPAVGSSQPFYLAYHGRDERGMLARYGRLVCDIMQAWHATTAGGAPAVAPRPARTRIRVGIVSAQMHRHSVWDVLTRGIVTQLDRSRFEVIGYHVSWRRDRETAVARKTADRFVMGHKSAQAWAERIVQDRPDVLLYPELGMDPLTVKLAALRLAPVQCVAWGHPMTSGLPTLDYYLSGELLEPPGGAAHYTESLVRLPGLGCYFEPLTLLDEDPAGTTGAATGGDDGVTRVICCQQVAKYHPADDELFVRIARDAGPCRFTFVELGRTHGAWTRFRQRIERAFAAGGLDPGSCLAFLPTLPRREFLALLAGMDVYLDSPSFSGFTTAIQALSCRGLPVVTCDGEFMRQRLAAGVLRQIGVTDTVATSRDEYVRIAVRLARDARERATLRERIRQNLGRAYRDTAPIRALEDFLLSARPASSRPCNSL